MSVATSCTISSLGSSAGTWTHEPSKNGLLVNVGNAKNKGSCIHCRYEALMEAFGGDAFPVGSAAELAAACRIAFAAKRPALINVAIDAFAGVESGNVHAFNQPSKL